MRFFTGMAVMTALACGSVPTEPDEPGPTVPPTIELYFIGSAADRDSAQLSWDVATAWFTARTGLTLKSDDRVRLVPDEPAGLPDSVKALVWDTRVTDGDRCGGAHVGAQVGYLYPEAGDCWTPWGLWSVNQPTSERWIVATYREKSAIHELMHLLGAVPATAPNHCGSSHVCDDNADVMWEFSISTRNQNFDADGDDYRPVIESSPWVSR